MPIKPKINRDFSSAKMHDSNLNWWRITAWTNSKWRSRSINPQNNRDLNQGILHLWSKFGDPGLNRWWVIMWTSSWLTHRPTGTQTDTGNDNIRRPKLASGKNIECTCQTQIVAAACWALVADSVAGYIALHSASFHTFHRSTGCPLLTFLAGKKTKVKSSAEYEPMASGLLACFGCF